MHYCIETKGEKMKIPESKLTKKQTKEFRGTIGDTIVRAVVRHDDECGNGHNSFSITGTLFEKSANGRMVDVGGGCIHDEIAKAIPQLEPYIKWHLTSSDGPMHYLANSLYLAGDKDCHGKRAGEAAHTEKRIYFKGFPIQIKIKASFLAWLQELENFDLEVMPVAHKPDPSYDWKPKYTFIGYEMDTWYKAPFDTEREALEFLEALQMFDFEIREVATSFSDGKQPELDAARRAAVWPDAKLEDFTKEKLEARLPELMEAFKRDVESLGLIY